MKRTTLLLIMCLTLTAAKCQEPDTIICYSPEDMQIKDDIIQAKNVLLFDTIEYFETLIAFKDSIINATADTINYLDGFLSAKITPTITGIRFDFVDTEIDRRFHFYYNDDKRSFSVGDGLNGTAVWPLDRY